MKKRLPWLYLIKTFLILKKKKKNLANNSPKKHFPRINPFYAGSDFSAGAITQLVIILTTI